MLPTRKDVTKIINQLVPKSKCPFCGSEQMFTGEIGVSNNEDDPFLHETNMATATEQEQGIAIKLIPKKHPSPMVKATCANCGYVMFFNYQILMSKTDLITKGDENASK